jgi:hypothetical protein
MKSLEERPTKGHLKRALRSLPQGLEVLRKTYDLAMARIDLQTPDNVALANKVLQWVAYSIRTLTVPELLSTVTIEPRTKELDEDFPFPSRRSRLSTNGHAYFGATFSYVLRGSAVQRREWIYSIIQSIPTQTNETHEVAHRKVRG